MLKNFKFENMVVDVINENSYAVKFKNVCVDGVVFGLEVEVRVEKDDKELKHNVKLIYMFEDDIVCHRLQFTTGLGACDIISQYDEKVDADIMKTISSLQAA